MRACYMPNPLFFRYLIVAKLYWNYRIVLSVPLFSTQGRHSALGLLLLVGPPKLLTLAGHRLSMISGETGPAAAEIFSLNC